MMPEVGAKQARELANQIKRELRSAEDGAGQSATKIGKALGGISDVVEKGLKKLGPLGGEVADVLFDFGAPLAEAAMGVGEVTAGMGAAGMAATAAGVAVLGVAAAAAAVAVGAGLAVAGMVAITEGAIAARDRLEEAGQAARIPPEASAALDQYQGATSRLWQEVDVLTVQLGGALAPALTVLADLVGDLIEWVNNLDKSFAALRRGIDQVVDMLPEWAKWPTAINAVKEAVNALEQGYTKLKESADGAKLAPTQEEIDRWKTLRDERAKLASEEAARQRKELTDAIEAEVKYNESIAELQQWLFDHQAELDQAQWDQKLELYTGLVQAHERAQDLMLAATIERQQRENALAAKAREDEKRDLQRDLDSIDKIAQATQSLADLVVENYQRRMDAGEELTEAERRAANTAFRIAQAAALAQIGIDLARAFAGFLATYSVLGPGAILAATAEVAAAAAAVAPILGQKPPFPMGESPNAASAGGGGGGGGGGELIPLDGPQSQGKGTAAGYADSYGGAGSGNANGSGGNGGSGRPQAASSNVYRSDGNTVMVVFSNGRVGKRRVY